MSLYMAEHIDPKKFEDALEGHRKFQQEELRIQREKAEAFCAGYEKAIEEVESMLHCANYESGVEMTAAYQKGADSAFYELCKELDIGCQDIREKSISIDEKAVMIAERICALFEPEDAGNA